MTNAEQTTINHMHHQTRESITVDGYIEIAQLTVQARIRSREDEAASERLATIARSTRVRGNVRREVGRLLILAGRRIGGESAPAGSPPARPNLPLAA